MGKPTANQYASLLQKSNSVYKKNFVTLLILSLSPILVIAINALITRLDVYEALGLMLFNDPSVSFAITWQLVAFMALSLAGSAFIISATMTAILAMVNSGDRIGVNEAIAGGMSFFKPILTLAAVAGLSVLGGFILAPIFGFIIAILLFYSIHALVNDRLPAVTAIGVSRDLVLRNLFPTAILFSAVVGVFYASDWILDRLTLGTGVYEITNLGVEALLVSYISVVYTALYLAINQNQKGA